MATGQQPASICRQNPVRDQPVTPLYQGRSYTEWNIQYIYSVHSCVPTCIYIAECEDWCLPCTERSLGACYSTFRWDTHMGNFFMSILVMAGEQCACCCGVGMKHVKLFCLAVTLSIFVWIDFEHDGLLLCWDGGDLCDVICLLCWDSERGLCSESESFRPVLTLCTSAFFVGWVDTVPIIGYWEVTAEA